MPEINKDTPNGGGNIINRFAISLLSKKYYKQAINEELMVNKSTGEILIKNSNGSIISYDAISRRHSSIDNATHMALLYNMTGNMYEVNIDGIIFPEIISYNTNIISESIPLKTNLKKIMFYIDLDEIDTGNEISSCIGSNPNVNIEIECKSTSTTQTITIQKTLYEIINNIVTINDNVDFGTSSYTTSLKSLSFENTMIDDDNVSLILHNIIITMC